MSTSILPLFRPNKFQPSSLLPRPHRQKATTGDNRKLFRLENKLLHVWVFSETFLLRPLMWEQHSCFVFHSSFANKSLILPISVEPTNRIYESASHKFHFTNAPRAFAEWAFLPALWKGRVASPLIKGQRSSLPAGDLVLSVRPQRWRTGCGWCGRRDSSIGPRSPWRSRGSRRSGAAPPTVRTEMTTAKRNYKIMVVSVLDCLNV